MHDNRTKSILESLQQGQISVDDALLQLKLEPFQDLGYAKVDHHRRLRQGVPEVIYGAGKTPEQMVGIVSAMEEAGQETVLITRLSPEAAEIVGKTHPLTYHEMGRIATVGPLPEPDGLGTIVIATGGTSDVPVAEEAAVTAQALGNRVRTGGVSFSHRTTDSSIRVPLELMEMSRPIWCRPARISRKSGRRKGSPPVRRRYRSPCSLACLPSSSHWAAVRRGRIASCCSRLMRT